MLVHSPRSFMDRKGTVIVRYLLCQDYDRDKMIIWNIIHIGQQSAPHWPKQVLERFCQLGKVHLQSYISMISVHRPNKALAKWRYIMFRDFNCLLSSCSPFLDWQWTKIWPTLFEKSMMNWPCTSLVSCWSVPLTLCKTQA